MSPQADTCVAAAEPKTAAAGGIGVAAIISIMNANGPLLPRPKHVPEIPSDDADAASADVISTRDHGLIRQWAEKRHAEPATGEETKSGPASIKVNDQGAGVRFNFPGVSKYRPISWDEWFENFDAHGCIFVCDSDARGGALSNRYQIVKHEDWKGSIG